MDNTRAVEVSAIVGGDRARLNEGRLHMALAPVEGICLYPVTNYPGWDDERHCPTGLLGYIQADGGRPVYEPLAEEIAVQQRKACCVEPASCRLDQACNRKVAASVSAPRPDAYGGRLGSPAREARAER